MNSTLRIRRLWIAGLAAVAVGAAFLLAWSFTRDRLPPDAILVPQDVPTLSTALERAVAGSVIVLDARRGPFEGGVTVTVPDVMVRSRHGVAAIRGGADALISVEADRVAIEGLDFEGTGTGIAVAGQECRIRDVTFRSLAVAVRVAGAGCVVERLAVESCSTAISIDGASEAHVLGARVRRAATATSVSGGSGIVLEDCVLAESDIGVRLFETDLVRLVGCRVADMSVAGVVLENARRTDVERTSFARCDVGVRTAGSSENAFCDNVFVDCRMGLQVVGGSDDLIARNTLRGGELGIAIERASAPQILRNSVDSATIAGILLDRADGAQVLDVRAHDCAAGVVVVASSHAAVRRGDVRGGDVGMALINGALGNTVAENRIYGAAEGIVLAGSSRDVVVNNAIGGCERGVTLVRPGYGTRVESNEVSECGIGLVWTDSPRPAPSPWERLGFVVDRSSSAAPPLVADNEFRACAADVQNETATPLLVGGNRWSGEAARVLGDVRVPDAGTSSAIGLGAAGSTADLLLARLLEWMLLERGVRVIDLVGIGSNSALAAAFDAGDVDVAWVGRVETDADGGTFWTTPLARGGSLVAAAAIASGVEAERGGANASLRGVNVAIPRGLDRRIVAEALAQHGLVALAFRDVAASAEAESLLKFGSVDCAIVDAWEETATLAGFVALDRVKLDEEAIGLRVGQLGAPAAAALRDAFDRLVPRLSDDVLRSLTSRVRLLQRDPAAVAMEFLLREGLIEGYREGGAR